MCRGPDAKPNPRDFQRVIQEGKHSNVDHVSWVFSNPVEFEGCPTPISIAYRSDHEEVPDWIEDERRGPDGWDE